MVVRVFKSLWLATAIVGGMLMPAAWAELSMTLDRNPVRVNETFTLDIKTDQVDADEPRLDLPEGIELLRRNTISSRSIVNGKISAERTWRYSLVARRSGELVFPALKVGDDKTAPLSVSVLTADSKQTAAIGNQPIVLKATVDQRSVYAQQQLILTVQLLRNVPVRFAQLTEPQLPNALVQKLGDDSEYETTVNGVNYLVIERRYAIFPQQAGELVIDLIRFQGDVNGERQQSIFGAFNETQPVSLQTQPITVTVQAPAQTDNWLPAQQVTLADSLSVEPYRAGEPLTWTITLTADGVLPAQLPELTPDIGKPWRIYPDQAQDNVQVTANGVRTVRSQKFALVPLHEGEQALPALQLPWWRLSDNTAQLATLDPQVLTVEADANAASQPVHAAPVAAPVSKPAPAVTAVPEAVAAVSPTFEPRNNGWPWLAALFATLWLVTLLLWLHSKRSRQAPESAGATVPAVIQREGSARALSDACKRHDAHAARDHLLRLTGASSLGTLAQQCDGHTAAAIAELNHALYGPPPQRWQGDALAVVLPLLLTPARSANNRQHEPDLPPLYPAN